VRLQVGELAAHSGEGHVQASPSRRQAAAIDDGGKHGHGFETVHCSEYREEASQIGSLVVVNTSIYILFTHEATPPGAR